MFCEVMICVHKTLCGKYDPIVFRFAGEWDFSDLRVSGASVAAGKCLWDIQVNLVVAGRRASDIDFSDL